MNYGYWFIRPTIEEVVARYNMKHHPSRKPEPAGSAGGSPSQEGSVQAQGTTAAGSEGAAPEPAAPAAPAAPEPAAAAAAAGAAAGAVAKAAAEAAIRAGGNRPRPQRPPWPACDVMSCSHFRYQSDMCTVC